MLNIPTIARRIGAYATTWVAAFFLVLIAALVARFGLGFDLIDTADVLLPIAFAVLALLTGVFIILALLDKQTISTHLVIIAGVVLLVLPLLWAPVLAVIVVAWFAQVSIEYSAAYAQFRIIISQILFPLSQLLFGPTANAAWAFFQGVGTVIGVLSGIRQTWALLRRIGDAASQRPAASTPE